MKKYSVTYVAGSTGFGWEDEFDRLDEFEDFIDAMREEYTAAVSVWDNEARKFIFKKKVLTLKCEIDFLHSWDRDMRTTTRKKKACC